MRRREARRGTGSTVHIATRAVGVITTLRGQYGLNAADTAPLETCQSVGRLCAHASISENSTMRTQ